MPSFYHVLVTKFNVRSYPDTDLEELANWTTQRIELFKKYCLPSILGQSNQNFDWLLQIDESTAGENMNFLEKLVSDHPQIFLTKLNSYQSPSDSIINFIKKQNKPADYLITTRVDNDDLLHEDFVDFVQLECNNSSKTRILNPIEGFALDITKEPHLLFLTKQRENPFISFVEPFDKNIKTVRKHKHYEWSGREKIKHIKYTEPLWIQLIHSKNLVNTVTGKGIAQPKNLDKFQLENKLAVHPNTKKHNQIKRQVFLNRLKNKFFGK